MDELRLLVRQSAGYRRHPHTTYRGSSHVERPNPPSAPTSIKGAPASRASYRIRVPRPALGLTATPNEGTVRRASAERRSTAWLMTSAATVREPCRPGRASAPAISESHWIP